MHRRRPAVVDVVSRLAMGCAASSPKVSPMPPPLARTTEPDQRGAEAASAVLAMAIVGAASKRRRKLSAPPLKQLMRKLSTPLPLKSRSDITLEERAILTQLDEAVVQQLANGTLRLISTEFITSRPEGYKLPRMQELARIDGALLPPAMAAELLKKADRSVLAVSYGWLSAGEPDPNGRRFAAIQRALQTLEAGGELRGAAGLFWDYGSLPQKPRTATEDRTFKLGLQVMANLYASALGTAVLQLKQIPARPKDAVGAVRVMRLPNQSYATKPALTKIFGRYGEIRDIAIRGADEATVRFGEEKAALQAMYYDPKMLGLGTDAIVCHEYNDRPYDARGWCAFEEAVSLEFLGRSRKYGNEDMRAIMEKPRLAKVYMIGHRADGVPEARQPAGPQDKISVRRSIEAATFIGKGDRKVVLDLYKRFQLDGAHVASRFNKTMAQAANGGNVKHSVAARQALAEEAIAARRMAAERK